MTDNTTAKVAVVTGATSGIGLASARLLASTGHRVFIGARNADNVAATVKELQAEGLEVVEQLPLIVKPSSHNTRYLKTKKERMAHKL